MCVHTQVQHACGGGGVSPLSAPLPHIHISGWLRGSLIYRIKVEQVILVQLKARAEQPLCILQQQAARRQVIA